MIRKLVLIVALAASGFAAGCVTSPYPSSASLPPRVMPPAPARNYAYAPRAPLLGALNACNAYGSNLGQVGESGQALDYTPYIYTPAGPLLRAPVENACLSSGFGFRGAATGGG